MPIVWPGHFDAHKNISLTPSADDMTPMRNHNAALLMLNYMLEGGGIGYP